MKNRLLITTLIAASCLLTVGLPSVATAMTDEDFKALQQQMQQQAQQIQELQKAHQADQQEIQSLKQLR